MNRELYKLVEGTGDECEGCALTEHCDNAAAYLDIMDFMLCAEEEDFELFKNPIYVKKEITDEDKNSIR